MLKLLPVTFRRMFRSPIYWICMVLMILDMVSIIMNNYHYTNLWDLGITPDNSLFSGISLLNVLCAVFVSLFIGLEYSNKTIRNKIIVGHSKTTIYLCNVIVCSVGTLILYIIPLIFNATAGVALLGGYANPKNNMIYLLCSLFTIIAVVAIVVFFAMQISNRVVSLIFVVVLVLLLNEASVRVDIALAEPKMTEDYIFNEEGTEIVDTIEIENPMYVEGVARDVLEFIVAFLPHGQAYQYGNPELPDNIALYPIYSLGFTVLATCGGVLIFRRKDIN